MNPLSRIRLACSGSFACCMMRHVLDTLELACAGLASKVSGSKQRELQFGVEDHMNGRICSSILRGLHSSLVGRSAKLTGPPLAAHTVPFTDCSTSRSEHLPNSRPIQTAVAALEQRLQVSAAAFSSCAPWLSRCQRHASTSAPATAAAATAEATHDRAASSLAASSRAAEEQPVVTPGRVQHTPAPPWTPTRELRKRNFLPRRMGHLMQVRVPAALCRVYLS